MEHIHVTGPVPVLPARVRRTYRGGRLLDERRGIYHGSDTNFPEEWILSTVTAINPDGTGDGICRARLLDRTVPLTDVVQDMGVLAKVIDSAERLSIQVHPDRRRAKTYFGSPYGKTECWHILGTRNQTTCIYLGFRPGITREIWSRCFERQDIREMLDWMHRIEVKVGETYLIPGGLPHAIGPGCMLFEIQEPTDYTLRVERTTSSGAPIPDHLIHQGIGVEHMLDCFDYLGMNEKELLAQLKIPAVETIWAGCRWNQLIGTPQVNEFSLLEQQVKGSSILDVTEREYGLYLWEGTGSLTCGETVYNLESGSQFYIPAGSSPAKLEAGAGIKLFCIQGRTGR